MTETRPIGTPALDDAHRIGWGLALRLLASISAAALLGVLFLVVGPLPRFFIPVLFFLLLRIVGDGAHAFGGPRPVPLFIEGHAKAAAWAVLAIGLWGTIAGATPFWIVGAGLTLAGMSLWGHHTHTEKTSRKVAVAEGVLGAFLIALGLAAAATVLALPAPWSVVVPFAALALGLALASRTTLRLVRRARQARPQPAAGLGAWYQEHFFRLTLLFVAIAAYLLFVRDTLRGVVPLLFVFEYSAAVFVLGFLLWSLRGFLSKRLVESPIRSLNARHEQNVERQGERDFDAVEDAFGRFVELGDTEALQTLGRHLQDQGVAAETALAPIFGYTRRDVLLLVHPGWLYGARLATVALVAFAVAALASAVAALDGGPQATDLPLLVFALGVYAAQWNRYGGHFALKLGLAYGGLAMLLTTQAARFVLGTGLGPLIFGVLALLPLVHPLRARKGRPVPRFAYRGTDPLADIEQLRTRTEASAVQRILWTGGIGLVVFFIVGELSRFAPALSVLFTLYLIIGLVIVVNPVLLAAGLRLGRQQVQRRHERERADRRARLEASLPRLDEAFARTGRHGGPLLGPGRAGRTP